MTGMDARIGAIRAELTAHGFTELRSAAEVDATLGNGHRTVLLAVNSTCPCAAAHMRPAVVAALRNTRRPEVAATVFAGQDEDATSRARSYLTGHAPSSPAIALLRDGAPVLVWGRDEIEASDPRALAEALKRAFEEYC